MTDTETITYTQSTTKTKTLTTTVVDGKTYNISNLTDSTVNTTTYSSTKTNIDVLTYKPDVSGKESRTITETQTLSNTTIAKETLSITNTTTIHQLTTKNTTTFTISLTYIVTQTYVSTNVETILFIADEEYGKSKLNSGTIILISCLVIAAIFILSIIGYTLYRKVHQASSSGTKDGSDSPEETNLFGGEGKTEFSIMEMDSDIDQPIVTIDSDPENVKSDEDENYLNVDF